MTNTQTRATAVDVKTQRVPDSTASPRGASAHVSGLSEVIELPPSRIPAFDVYITVDWSAASAPTTGENSVWCCRCEWRTRRLVTEANENPPTRLACFELVRAQLRNLVTEGRSILVAFDFPFGYPAGFARARGLNNAPWRAVWNEAIARHLAGHDAVDTLDRLFSAPASLESAVRRRVETEEGWIRGVTPAAWARDAGCVA